MKDKDLVVVKRQVYYLLIMSGSSNMQKIRNDMDTVYIGYDPREHAAYEVLKFSIEIRAKNPVRIVPLKKDALIKNGMFRKKV